MLPFNLNSISSALDEPGNVESGVDFSGKSLKLDTAKDAQPIVDAINGCSSLHYLTLTGNTLGVAAAEALAAALERHPELKEARFSDMFTGRMKTEIPPALSALGEGMIAAGARLRSLDLSDNAFGPIGVEGLAKLLQSDVCSELEELRLNNNGLGITGGRLLAGALSARPRRLKIFIAGRNRLENDGAKALAAVFKSMGTLEELAMPQNGINHAGISALADAFRDNQRLSTLNLNDNTVTRKGAVAVAQALPRLKNLRCINFGDCLLKSKGAQTLAKAFRDNKLPLESVDLSHNEIGREACLELAEALSASSRPRLASVVLAGNSLGDAAHKQNIKDKLGAAANLSDGEGSDDEFVTDAEDDGETDSDTDAESDAHSDADAHSDCDDTLRTVRDLQISLDTSGVEEVESDVARFLKEPTEHNLSRLGPGVAAVIDAHLQAIKDPTAYIQAYVEATLLVSGLPTGRAAAQALLLTLGARSAQRHAVQWLLADSVLRGLALIKSEDKSFKIRWALPPCYEALAAVISHESFPPALRDTLKFFISSKLATMSPELRATVERLPALYT